jgi:hypothetical protein
MSVHRESAASLNRRAWMPITGGNLGFESVCLGRTQIAPQP